MKIKRYFAEDFRTAMRDIRRDQGPDAVILSTHEVEGGVEICAADDSAPPAASASTQTSTAPLLLPTYVGLQEPRAEMNTLSTEVRNLRALVERQLAALTWNDYTRREPGRARALNELLALGLSRDVATAIATELTQSSVDAEESHAHFVQLTLRLQTLPLTQICNGRVALVGPTGAGKSTLLAKLAVRAVLEHGAASVAIITMDSERLGAIEQSRSLGRLLDVDTRVARGDLELTAMLQSLAHKRAVFIDTAGLPGRDCDELRQLAAALTTDRELSRVLVIPSSAQAAVIDDYLNTYAALQPTAVVLTRVDEALSLGAALGGVLRRSWPLAGISDGPGIPEHLQPARSAELVARARALAQKTQSPDVFERSTHAA
jgi:flagellar biosynthesis protein FlhF